MSIHIFKAKHWRCEYSQKLCLDISEIVLFTTYGFFGFTNFVIYIPVKN